MMDERDSSMYSMSSRGFEIAPTRVLNRNHIIEAKTAEDARTRANQEKIITKITHIIITMT